MNPIDLVKTQFETIGLNDTQIKGELFFLAGIYSFFKNEASDQEKNRIYNYVEKSKFPKIPESIVKSVAITPLSFRPVSCPGVMFRSASPRLPRRFQHEWRPVGP